MAVGKVKIFKLEFTFVFRHRYEKEDENKLLHSLTMWREWELGLFYKKNRIVGKKNFNKVKEWNNNLVNQYMLGINLLICKAWFTVHKGGMTLNINNNEKNN